MVSEGLVLKLSSSHEDKMTGITHTYIGAEFQSYPIHPNQISLHFNTKGELIWKTGLILPNNLSNHLIRPDFSKIAAILQRYLVQHEEKRLILPVQERNKDSKNHQTFITATGGKPDSIKTQLCYFLLEHTLIPSIHIYWQRRTPSEWWSSFVDIKTGEILSEQNQMLSCSFDHYSLANHSLFSIEKKGESSFQSLSQCQNCYHVFAYPKESPGHGSRTTIYSPWQKASNASPLGWHNDGFQFYTSSQGNNVDAYEDSDNTNSPSFGDGSRAIGSNAIDYDFEFHQDLHPTLNKDASITNLFYWSNIMHDVWYQYGFDESSGNFQYSNFGRGGWDWDNVISEGLDFINGARNNANFGTPPDGYPPRMQMYVWKQPSYDTLWLSGIGLQTQKIMFVPAAVGPEILGPIEGRLIVPDDGSNPVGLGCNNYINAQDVNGKIVIVDLGLCSSALKIQKAENAGAKAIVLIQNRDNAPNVIGGLTIGVQIPVVMVSKTDGDLLKTYLPFDAQIVLWPPSDWKFSVGNQSFLFSKAYFGASIPKLLEAPIVVATDQAMDFQDACQTITNGTSLNGSIAIINDGLCEPSYKALQVQQQGAKMAVICMDQPGLPYVFHPGNYGHLLTIPVIGMSQNDCQILKNSLPAQAQITNQLPVLVDGDFDAGIIAHEYAHGITNRLTGGPLNVNCLSNLEQGGEGWSDYFGLAMTTKVGDNPYKKRGLATWPVGQAPSGEGIRPTPYSVDLNVCPANYEMLKDLVNISQPHGIGYIWCSMLWDLHWALTNQSGFEADIYKSNSNFGNIKAHKIILQGLKLQACQPGFVDARNAILKADSLLYNGSHACLIWNVFARRGLGWSANQGNSNKRDDGVSAFNIPPGCALMSETQLFGQIPLALESIVMRGEKQSQQIILDWEMLDQQMVKSQSLYRRMDQGDWLEIKKWNDLVPYIYSDSILNGGKQVYYQMKAILEDGNYISSNIISIPIDRSAYAFRLQPNPTKDAYTLLIMDQTIQEAYQLEIYSSDGHLLDQIQVNEIGTQNIRINTGHLSPGMYFLKIKSNDFLNTLKFMVNP